MAFDLGAIQGSLKIQINDFLDGLKTARTQAQQTSAELGRTLHTRVTVDTAGMQQAMAQAKALVAEPLNLELEFDTSDAEQGAFGFMRNLDAIQAEYHQTQEASRQAAQQLTQAARQPQSALTTLRGHLQRLWDGMKAGTQQLLQGFLQGAAGAHDTGEAAEKAGERGASGFRTLATSVLDSAKGFTLAQAGIASIEQALSRLQGFFRGVVEEVAEDERAALAWARALQRGGQTAGQTFSELVATFDTFEPRLNAIAASIGVSNKAFLQFTQRGIEAGVPIETAAQYAETLTRALKGALGPTERLQVINQELRAIFQGNAQAAQRLSEQVGVQVLQQFQILVAAGKHQQAQAFLNAQLQVTNEQRQAELSTWETITDTYQNLMDDMRSSEAGKQFVAAMKGLLEGVNADLKAQGPLWRALTSTITLGTEALKLFHSLAKGIKAIFADPFLFGPVYDFFAKVKAFDDWIRERARSVLPEALSKELLNPPIAPPGAPTPDHTGQVDEAAQTQLRVKTAQQILLRDLTQETAMRQRQVDLAEALGQQQIANAQLSGDAVAVAQAEAAARALIVARQRELAETQLVLNQDLLETYRLDKEKTLEDVRQQEALVTQLRTQAEALSIQTQALALDERRAVVQARLTTVTQQAQQAAEGLQAAGERELAAMRAMGASELAILQREAGLRDQALAAQQAQLQMRRDALAAAGALSDVEREQLARADAILGIKRDTNRLEAALVQLTTAAAHASAMLQAADERRTLTLQRQLDQEDSRLELQQLYLRGLNLPADKEQLALTLLQAQSKARQLNAQLTDVAAQKATLAAKLELDLVGKSAEEAAKLRAAYENAGLALDNNVAKSREQLLILQETARQAIELEKARPFKELAADLVQAGKSFTDALMSGTGTFKQHLQTLLQDAGKSFLDAALKPFWESLQKDLAGGLQKLITGKGPETKLSPEAQALMEAGTTHQTAATQWETVGSQWETVGSQWQAVSAELQAAISQWQTQLAAPAAPAITPGATPQASPWEGEGLTAAVKQWLPEITKVAAQVGLDPKLIAAVMRVESGGQAGAKSGAGAQGPMQLMPGTAKKWGVDAADAFQNILGGGKELKWLSDRYAGDLGKILAGYNAGPGRADKYGADVPFTETKAYIAKVKAEFDRLGGHVAQLGQTTQTATETLPPMTTGMQSFTQAVQQATAALQTMAKTPPGGAPGPGGTPAAPGEEAAPGGFEPITADEFEDPWGDIGSLSAEAGTQLSAFADDAATTFESFNERAGLSFDSFMDAATAAVDGFGGDLMSIGKSLAKSLSSLLGGDGAGGEGGGWGNMIQAGIGLAITAVSSLLKDTSAKVESLGDKAKDAVQSTEHTRGLVAGPSNIPIGQLSQELSRAMRSTNDILLRIEQVLRSSGGSSAPAPAMAGAGGYSITVETLSGERY